MVDFIVDIHGKVWLTDVKRIQTIKAVKLSNFKHNLKEMTEKELIEHNKHI